MNKGSFGNADGKAGTLCSELIELPAGNKELVIHHAMPRPPDLAFLRITNKVADSGWNPGETAHIHPGGTSTPHFYIKHCPGISTAFVWGSSLFVPSQVSDANSTITITSWRVELVCVWLPQISASL